jgi:penicillin-binding protein 2
MLRKFFNKRIAGRGMEIEDSIMTITQKEKAIIETPFKRRGMDIIWYLAMAVILVLLSRVFFLDFVRGGYYSDISKNNRIRSLIIKAPRGKILDKFGTVIAGNIPSLDAIFIPADLPKDSAAKKNMAQELSGILNINSGNIETQFGSSDPKSLSPILLKENISEDEALIMAEKGADFPGIAIDKTAIRSYQDGNIFSTFVGYDGKINQAELAQSKNYLMTDYIGKTGLEKNYEKYLRGNYGAVQVEVDASGNIKKTISVTNPIPGNDLVLNVDADLQKKLYDSLNGILEKSNSKTAAAVAIDPQTGGILAMVSLPSYDNNLFAKGITGDDYNNLINNPDLPLFNRSIAGVYPPGSTIKPAIASAALSEGTITPSTIIDGLGGVLRVGNFSFGDWKAHSPSDVRTAIAQSNDIFFYTLGGGYGNITGLGMDRMKKYENMFGFGAPTGIDIPGEAAGLIPSESWKQDTIHEKWYIGDSYHAAIGQGFVGATPIQLANYAAAIANGGTLYLPRFVYGIKNSDGSTETLPPAILNQNFIKPDVMNIVREGMRMVVESGTAQVLKNMPVAVAGKTGTAQFGTENKTHSWFLAFAPYDHPTIAMAVIVEGGGEGNSAALPVTQDVLNWYFTEDKK